MPVTPSSIIFLGKILVVVFSGAVATVVSSLEQEIRSKLKAQRVFPYTQLTLRKILGVESSVGGVREYKNKI